ncbi:MULTISPECIES: hypothetical protein [Geobacillus]|uniref:hypothetical protein n=1 Tax=Geobacillus TaxID=129337 RepID=UPI001442DA5F|nr:MULTISPECIES: hypothetical protein [Geobacillus]MDF9296264.1 hypothetical protein [Geobacillus stearothermophilus]QIZ65853.1 hypothetical protein HF500_16855 [Geobacillus subterraneus]QOR83754.1 hypothetical protein IMZ17_14470 [Geobacillus stearothermophilus]WJQ13531.1 hypothetical protein QT238_15505 [Geobacillus stearothermophilus]
MNIKPDTSHISKAQKLAEYTKPANGPPAAPADLNHDGQIDLHDVLLALQKQQRQTGDNKKKDHQ